MLPETEASTVYPHSIHSLPVVTRVELNGRALRQLRRAPHHIVVKLYAWIDSVEERGLEQVRRIPGYNDHGLVRDLFGKAGVRVVQFAEVLEVHPHDY